MIKIVKASPKAKPPMAMCTSFIDEEPVHKK
jgi:hypothetical protein